MNKQNTLLECHVLLNPLGLDNYKNSDERVFEWIEDFIQNMLQMNLKEKFLWILTMWIKQPT